MWNFRGLAPESSRTLSIFTSLALLSGAMACGPSNGGGNPANYVIVFTLTETEDDDELTELKFTVEPDFGNFVGTGSTVDCALLDNAGDTATFSEDATGLLTVEIVATSDELAQGDDIVQCELVSTLQPTPDDFAIEITGAEPSPIEEVDVVVKSTDTADGELSGSAHENDIEVGSEEGAE